MEHKTPAPGAHVEQEFSQLEPPGDDLRTLPNSAQIAAIQPGRGHKSTLAEQYESAVAPTDVTSEPIAPRTILLVEDNWPVSAELKLSLEDFGYSVCGPAASVAEALDLLQQSDVDAAVLDIQLADEKVFPVAERLEQRQVPYIFLSGYSDPSAVPPHLQHRPRLSKPTTAAAILKGLADLFVH